MLTKLYLFQPDRNFKPVELISEILKIDMDYLTSRKFLRFAKNVTFDYARKLLEPIVEGQYLNKLEYLISNARNKNLQRKKSIFNRLVDVLHFQLGDLKISSLSLFLKIVIMQINLLFITLLPIHSVTMNISYVQLQAFLILAIGLLLVENLIRFSTTWQQLE